MTDFFIGEITPSNDGRETCHTASLQCKSPEKTDLLLIVYDEYGYQCLREVFPLRKGKSTVEFDCSMLRGGTHSAWIEVNGKTFPRSFFIEGKEERKSLIEKFKRLIQPGMHGQDEY